MMKNQQTSNGNAQKSDRAANVAKPTGSSNSANPPNNAARKRSDSTHRPNDGKTLSDVRNAYKALEQRCKNFAEELKLQKKKYDSEVVRQNATIENLIEANKKLIDDVREQDDVINSLEKRLNLECADTADGNRIRPTPPSVEPTNLPTDGALMDTEQRPQPDQPVNQGEAGAPTLENSPTQKYSSIAEKPSPEPHRIFVRNIDYYATEEEIERHFSECDVLHIELCKWTDGPHFGRSNGTAFIMFQNEEGMKRALGKNFTKIRTKMISILTREITTENSTRTRPSTPAPDFRPVSARHEPDPWQPQPRYQSVAGAQKLDNSLAIADALQQYDPNSVFVSNIFYGANEDDLRMHFAHCGVLRINFLRWSDGPYQGRSKGKAYITLQDQGGATRALEMHHTMLYNKPISVYMKMQSMVHLFVLNSQ